MVLESSPAPTRVNARRSDAFDLFNSRHFAGANPYLDTAAFVFDFALTWNTDPLPIADYVGVVSERYPQLRENSYDSHAALFAQTASAVSKLEMNLYFERWSCQPIGEHFRIAIESLHNRTSRSVAYCVWDWFESITRGQRFNLDDQIEELQRLFRQSVYGGPTVYALLRSAHEKAIPAFYLWEEGLMQYGYGNKLVRGIATTFDVDSHLDSDFTTRKDDCKSFLGELGFPVPKGSVVGAFAEALESVRRIGFPVAVKPVAGHKGIGVTADVRDENDLEQAYDRALAAIPEAEPVRVIVETSLSGKDYRILCVHGRFVAAMERLPAYVVGDGRSTLRELIAAENRKPERSDTPTSPMSKIQTDEAMELYLQEQALSQESVIDRDRTVYLRKVANLSAGGFSIDATRIIHPDTVILAQDIAQHFRLTCLGIDVIAQDLSKSWKDSSFGIIEINAAPGISMHLNPAIGEPVDVPARILESFFESGDRARIPIISFNHLSVHDLKEVIDHILLQHPHWTIGAVCREGIFVNRSQKVLNPDYNTNLLTLLRNPRLDLLIAEYNEEVLERDGMFYDRSNLVILSNPSDTERLLSRQVTSDATIVIQQGDTVTVQHEGLVDQFQLDATEPLSRIYLTQLASVL